MKTAKTLAGLAVAGLLSSGIGGCCASFEYPSNRTLLGSLTIGLSGCCKGEKYHYDGQIGKESVRFEESTIGHVHFLYVTKEDGTKIEYVDSCHFDFKLDIVTITKGDETITYDSDKIGYAGLKEWQEQFDDYLAKIIMEKQMKAVIENK